MNREQAMSYVGHCVDDTLCPRKIEEAPADARLVRLVGWQCGFEPLFIAVWSYLGVRLDDEEAEEIAIDYLVEMKWFANPDYKGRPPPPADYVL